MHVGGICVLLSIFLVMARFPLRAELVILAPRSVFGMGEMISKGN